MQRSLLATGMAVSAAALMSAPAVGTVNINLGTSATAYTDYTLNFDEPGGPTGLVGVDAWHASHGMILDSGVGGGGNVDDWGALYGWDLGDGLSWLGPFGAFMTFDYDLVGFSTEHWDPSGPDSGFNGGFSVFVFDDGVELANGFFDAAWGGIGDTWIDITTDGGDVFDQVTILGWGMMPETYLDNMSWDQVPAPGSLALLALAGAAMPRRRR
ncbi:MAG: hypothetical protein KAS72_13910 [Phycisphaerales bacterium]|nr:hypothetical protein [Phycisphaerales bacterium]